jgi:hypothetical protein
VATRSVTLAELADADPQLATLQDLNRPEEYLSALLRAGYPVSPAVAAKIVHCE